MKKLVASVGLVALGVSSVQTLSAQGLASPDPAKPWSISATLRGFYDDNFDTLPDDFNLQGSSRESWGYEIAPSAKLNLALDRTSIGLGYNYSYKYFEEQSVFHADKDSQSHEFNLALNHAFTPRYRLSARNGFVIGQEPDQLRSANTFTTLQRIPGDNIRNHGEITFGADLTRNFGLEVGYANSYFNYDNDLTDGGAGPSLSGLLDRLEHRPHIDARWILSPSTVGILGYEYGEIDYTADETLFGNIESEDRNSRSHSVYVGGEHSFTSDLSANLRVGARFTDYYNDPNGEESWSPFVRGSMRWIYAPQSYVEGGVGYDRTATDIFSVEGADFTRDQEAATIFASINHMIMPRLIGSLSGQFQNSTLEGGAFDDDTEQFYLVGLNLEYQFTRNFSAHVGYNYDDLESDIGRGFDRNRVYLGVTAAY